MTWVAAVQPVRVQAVVHKSSLDFYFHQYFRMDLQFTSRPPRSWATQRHQSCWLFYQNLSPYFPFTTVRYGLFTQQLDRKVLRHYLVHEVWLSQILNELVLLSWQAHQLCTYSKDTVHLGRWTALSICNDFAQVPFNCQSLVYNSMS